MLPCFSKIKESFKNLIKPKNKILVIDDDRGLQKMMRVNLAAQGYCVLSALTGEEGLKIARTQKPDLIILDVILPGVKGREVCAQLKGDSQTMDIPVVFLTAKDSNDDISAELAAGAISHVTKPFNGPTLAAEINRVLEALESSYFQKG